LSSSIDALRTFLTSPPGIALWLGGNFVVLACIIAESVMKYSVSGTRLRYKAATAFHTLFVPSILCISVSTLIDAASGQWVGVALGVAFIVALIIAWHRCKDDDSWWKGKGTKLKKKVRSLFATRSTAVVGAGA
jgi:hypothetical protein